MLTVNIAPATKIPKTKTPYFTYSIPKNIDKEKFKVGVEVIIPFAGRKISGIVWNDPKEKDKNIKYRLKDIVDIVDDEPVLSEKQMRLAEWISDYYYASLGQVLRLMAPKRVRITKSQSPDLEYKKTSFPDLTEAQKKTFNDIKSYHNDKFLIHGVTGSGKTEIYLRMMKEALKEGKQILFLVPEISLTPQTVQRIASRFNPSEIALLHSNISASEKYKAWQDTRSKKIKIIIGPRSAIFAPFRSLGLIIIDEEHDASYKQYDQNPRYHVRDISFQLSKLFGAKVILGSATPSVDSYYLAKKGDIKLLELSERYSGKTMPKVEIVDMREELKKRNFSIFSEKLIEKLDKTLSEKKQSMLFINRRGTSTFVMCRDCGFVIKCPHCEVPLVFHSGDNYGDNKLICHYCNYQEKNPLLCPDCGSQYIKYFGAGTEKIELELKKLFPSSRIARMDRDTMNKKFAHFNIFNDFLKGKYDILIGTQMITKGWDLPNVDLIGIISSDTVLNLPDFRSFERTFQLVTQIAGRTGRGKDRGYVVLQTYNPENSVIKSASAHDYVDFYEKEIKERKELGYPPYFSLIKLIYKSGNAEKIRKNAEEVARALKESVKNKELAVELLGPAPSFISKKRGLYYWQIIMKLPVNIGLEERNRLLDNIPSDWVCDINPESLL